MKKITLLVLLVCLTATAWAQGSYRQQYELLSRSGNTQVVRSLLEDWQLAEPDNDRMHAAWFDHLIREAIRPMMKISREPVRDAVMTVSDSLGNVYFYYMSGERDDSLFREAMHHLDRAISLAPDRLDYRLERIGAIEAAGLDASAHAQAVEELVARNARNGGGWMNDEGAVDTETFIEAVQQACGYLLTRQPPALEEVGRIAGAMLEQFPNHPLFLADLGTAAFQREDYRAAGKYFARALKASPDDMSLVRNLAVACRKSGKVKQAVALLGRLQREGTAEDAAFARQYLALIEKEKK